MTMAQETPTQTLEVMKEKPMTLHQRGCKITLGAYAQSKMPTWRQARILVLAKRASSRIMTDPAAVQIQAAWRAHVIAKEEHAELREVTRKAAHVIQTASRVHLAKVRRVREELTASVHLQAAARRLLARRQRRHLMFDIVLAIQMRARCWLARSRLREARAAACAIQACWRMVRSQVLGSRLANAARRLRAGSILSKYRAGGRIHERHERRVWVTEDLQRLCWSPVSSKPADEPKSISMSTVTAVTVGAKTTLMKKMERRADGKGLKFAVERVMWRALPLNDACAFSVIGTDRVLDFVAADTASAKQWLRDLRTTLLYSHHLDHEAAVSALEAGARRGSLTESAAAAA